MLQVLQIVTSMLQTHFWRITEIQGRNTALDEKMTMMLQVTNKNDGYGKSAGGADDLVKSTFDFVTCNTVTKHNS